MGYFIQKITPVVLSVLIAASVFMFCMLTRGGTEDKKGGKLIEGSAPLGKYEETINITVGQMISASNYVNGENEKNNIMYDICREVMNVNFQSVFAANIGTAYDYQLNTYILDGNVPDLFFCSQNQMSDLIEQGLIYDITDVYNEYASPELRLAMEYSYTGDIAVWNNGSPAIQKTPQLLDAASVNGRLYGLPFLADLFESCPLMWIRGDWLEKYLEYKGVDYSGKELNEFLPKNFSEYLDLVDYFTNNDPDENDEDDTFGFSIGFESKNLNGIANIYDAYPGYYMKDDDGKYYYGSAAEGMKETINLLNRLYNDGCIDQNSAFDGQTLKSALAAGKIGSFLGEYWSIMSYGLNDAYSINTSVDWLPWAIRDYDGNVIEPVVPYNISNNSFYCVGADCLNPEVIIILANHIVSRYFGDEGEFTAKTVEVRKSEKYKNVASELEMYLPLRLDAPNKNIRYAYDLQKAIRTGDSSFLTLDETTYYNNIVAFLNDRKGAGKVYYPYYKIFCENGAYNALTAYAEYDYEKDKNDLKVKFKRPAFYGMNTPEMAKYNSIVSDFEEQRLIRMYTQTNPVNEADWKSFTDRLAGKGVKEILGGLNG